MFASLEEAIGHNAREAAYLIVATTMSAVDKFVVGVLLGRMAIYEYVSRLSTIKSGVWR